MRLQPLDNFDDQTAHSNEIEHVDNRDAVEVGLKSLPPNLREIICRRFGIGRTPLERWQVARELRVLPADLEAMESEAIGLLRKRLVEDGTADLAGEDQCGQLLSA